MGICGLPCSSAVFGVLELLLGGFGGVGGHIDFAAGYLLVDHRTEILHRERTGRASLARCVRHGCLSNTLACFGQKYTAVSICKWNDEVRKCGDVGKYFVLAQASRAASVMTQECMKARHF